MREKRCCYKKEDSQSRAWVVHFTGFLSSGQDGHSSHSQLQDTGLPPSREANTAILEDHELDQMQSEVFIVEALYYLHSSSLQPSVPATCLSSEKVNLTWWQGRAKSLHTNCRLQLIKVHCHHFFHFKNQ